MSIIFFGSSDFSLAALRACLDSGQKVMLVLTTPDQKKGRGLKEAPTPVKAFAGKNKIPVEAAANLKSPELLRKAQDLKPELFVVSSYGKMIPADWLKIPSRLALNVHPSLLPKLRGAAPIQRAVLAGETHTGVSIAEVTNQLDAGDLFHQEKIALPPEMDAEELAVRLADLSYEILKRVFKKIELGTLTRVPQDEACASYAYKLKKEEAAIVWTASASEIAHRIRGLKPWPVAQASFKKETLQILKARPELIACAEARPGQILAIGKDGTLRVQTGEGALLLEKVRPAGKKEMTAADYARGRRLVPGEMLDT